MNAVSGQIAPTALDPAPMLPGLLALYSEATPSGLPAISPPEGVAAAVAEGDGKPTAWLSKPQGAGRPEGVVPRHGTARRRRT